jgi:hypothetical protein
MCKGLKTILVWTAVISFLFIGCGEESTKPEDGIPIRIVSPDDGDVLFNPVYVVAQTGSGFSITDVEFLIDDEHVWIDNDRPFEYYWNIFSYENNSEHVIEAVGYAEDTTYTSDPVTVTISLDEGLLFVSAYVPNSGQAFGVEAYQNIMFVATGQEGVELINIIDKSMPTYLSRFESAGQALKVDVLYPDLFIADLSGGVFRADFSDSVSLVQNGSYSIQVQANDIAVSNELLFVADQNGFIILDNTLTDSLVSLFRSNLFSGSNYVVARNDTAFMTNIDNLYIIGASNPGSPTIVSTYNTPGNARGAAVIDTFLFVADGIEGVMALSISDPENPRYLARYATQGAVSTVEAADSTLFAGTFSGDIIALDYTQSDTLRLLDVHVIEGVYINQLKFDFPYLYAATSQGVSVLRFIR